MGENRTVVARAAPVDMTGNSSYLSGVGGMDPLPNGNQTMTARSQNSRFQRSMSGASGVYRCKMCGKKTRETGEGESGVEMCRVCLEYSYAENGHSDNDHEHKPDPQYCPICQGKPAPWAK